MAEIIVKNTPLRRAWRKFAQLSVFLLLRLLYRVRVYGIENIPKEGPGLLVCNHQSYIDPFFCHSWVWRPFFYVARENLFRGFMDKLLRSLFVIPIKQGQSDLAAMKAIIGVIQQGNIICLYPEGSRTFDGRLDEVKPGISLITRRTGAPLLPMVVEGLYEAWPRTQKWPSLFKPVSVMYGKPMTADHIKDIGDKAFTQELTEIFQTMQNNLRVKMGREPFDYSSEDDPQ